MSNKLPVGTRSPGQYLNQVPADQPWVWQSRDLRQSDAWRSAGINVRRVIDFLLLEHMKHAGGANGLLKAPQRQLEEFGIGARYVTKAIREAEELGLIDGYRRGQRVATTYALTWFPLHNGTPATNRWQTYHNPVLKPLREPKSKELPPKGKAGLPSKRKADRANLPIKGRVDAEIYLPIGRQNLPSHGKAHSISSYQAEDNYSVLGDGQSISGRSVPCMPSVPAQRPMAHPLVSTAGDSRGTKHPVEPADRCTDAARQEGIKTPFPFADNNVEELAEVEI